MGKISKLLKEEFSAVYCDTCKYDGHPTRCDECNRKSMGFALSKEAAKDLEKRIKKLCQQ